MHQMTSILLDAIYVLAKRKQNGSKRFLVSLAHTIISFELKDGGIRFLKRHKRSPASDFMLVELLPRLRKLELSADQRRVLHLMLAARMLEGQALRYQPSGEMDDWSKVDLSKALEPELLQEARAML